MEEIFLLGPNSKWLAAAPKFSITTSIPLTFFSVVLCKFFIGYPGPALTYDLCEASLPLAAARLDCCFCLHRCCIKCSQSHCEVCAALTLSVSDCVCVCVLLQEQNSVLASENESQREQYERCLDEVSVDLVYLVSLRGTFKGAVWLARCFTYLEKFTSLFARFVFTSCEQNEWYCWASDKFFNEVLQSTLCFPQVGNFLEPQLEGGGGELLIWTIT